MLDIIELNKGIVTTVHNAITGTTASNVVKCGNHNAIDVKVELSGSGAWTVKVQGAFEKNGTYVDWYDVDGDAMSTGSISASRGIRFVGVPSYIKIVATKDSGTATVTVKVQPTTN
jgi:hypothetical protein